MRKSKEYRSNRREILYITDKIEIMDKLRKHAGDDEEWFYFVGTVWFDAVSDYYRKHFNRKRKLRTHVWASQLVKRALTDSSNVVVIEFPMNEGETFEQWWIRAAIDPIMVHLIRQFRHVGYISHDAIIIQ